MPPKPAAAAKGAEDDAADHEKEFVEKELIISFLKTRLSRYGSSRSDCVSYHNTASQLEWEQACACCLQSAWSWHKLLWLFMKPCAVSPGGQSKGKHKAQGRLESYKQTHPA